MVKPPPPGRSLIQIIGPNNRADVAALSALLTTTMPAMEDTVKAIKEAGLEVAVVIGGAPVTAQFATEIGADGFSEDVPGAVAIIKKLLNT